MTTTDLLVEFRAALRRLEDSALRPVARRNARANAKRLLARARAAIDREFPPVNEDGTARVAHRNGPCKMRWCPECRCPFPSIRANARHYIARHHHWRCWCGADMCPPREIGNEHGIERHWRAVGGDLRAHYAEAALVRAAGGPT